MTSQSTTSDHEAPQPKSPELEIIGECVHPKEVRLLCVCWDIWYIITLVCHCDRSSPAGRKLKIWRLKSLILRKLSNGEALIWRYWGKRWAQISIDCANVCVETSDMKLVFLSWYICHCDRSSPAAEKLKIWGRSCNPVRLISMRKLSNKETLIWRYWGKRWALKVMN